MPCPCMGMPLFPPKGCSSSSTLLLLLRQVPCCCSSSTLRPLLSHPKAYSLSSTFSSSRLPLLFPLVCLPPAALCSCAIQRHCLDIREGCNWRRQLVESCVWCLCRVVCGGFFVGPAGGLMSAWMWSIGGVDDEDERGLLRLGK